MAPSTKNIVLIICVFITCCFGDTLRVTLENKQVQTNGTSKKHAVCIKSMHDERTNHALGFTMNNNGDTVREVIATNDILQWVQKELEIRLAAHGFIVHPICTDTCSDLQLSVSIDKLQVKANSSYSSEIALAAGIFYKDNLFVNKQFSVSSHGDVFGRLSTKLFAKIANKSLEKVIDEIIPVVDSLDFVADSILPNPVFAYSANIDEKNNNIQTVNQTQKKRFRPYNEPNRYSRGKASKRIIWGTLLSLCSILNFKIAHDIGTNPYMEDMQGWLYAESVIVSGFGIGLLVAGINEKINWSNTENSSEK
jgi:hypothetical protein